MKLEKRRIAAGFGCTETHEETAPEALKEKRENGLRRGQLLDVTGFQGL